MHRRKGCGRPAAGNLPVMSEVGRLGGDPVGGPVTGEPAVLFAKRFTAADVTAVRHALASQVAAAGLAGEVGDDFVLAANELVTNAVRHGGGSGRVTLRRLDDVVVCEVTDHGGGADALPVRAPRADVPGGRGLWLAHQLTGSLLLTRRPDGVTAMVSACLSPTGGTASGEPAAARAEDPDSGGR